MTDSTLIELDCVSKSFDGGRSFAVNDLSLAIERGSFVTLVGPSGSGKTTTCKFINRLIDRCRAQGGADYGGGHTPRADGRTADPDVAAMMSMPARQAERVQRIIHGLPNG